MKNRLSKKYLSRKRNIKRRVKNSTKKNKISKQRRTKKGGAAEEKTFSNTNELKEYLVKNRNWIDRVDVYKKEDFQSNNRAIKHLDKNNFSQLYEISDINEYTFLFY
jgi:hypothetical protein